MAGAHGHAGRAKAAPGDAQIAFGHRIFPAGTHHGHVGAGHQTVLGFASGAHFLVQPDYSLIVLVNSPGPADVHALGVVTMLTVEGDMKAVSCPGHDYSWNLVNESADRLTGSAADALAVIQI